MTDTSAAATPSAEKRRRIVSTDFSGLPTFNIHAASPAADGTYPVAGTYILDVPTVFADRTALLHTFAAMGFASVAQNFYTKLDETTPDTVRAVFDNLAKSITDGSWSPGRSLTQSEPDDIVLAIAEATGQPWQDVQKRVDEEIVRDADGNAITDKGGRTRRVFTKSLLDNIAKDPQVAPIMARLAKERADRLAKTAREGRNAPTTGGLDMFGGAKSNAAAAN